MVLKNLLSVRLTFVVGPVLLSMAIISMDIFSVFQQNKEDFAIILDGCFLSPLTKKELLRIKNWFRDMDLAREAFGMIADEKILNRVVGDYFRNIFSSSMEILGIWVGGPEGKKPQLEGFVNYSVYMNPELTGRIGIVIGSENRRNSGLGTKSLKGALYYLFKHVHIETVELDTAFFNNRAQKCFYKCGFEKIGESTDINMISGELVHKVTMTLSRESFMKNLDKYFTVLPVYEIIDETENRSKNESYL